MIDLSICICGAAGDGIKEAGKLTGKIFSNIGYHSFVYQEYESRIRGGENISYVRFSERKIYTHKKHYDLLVVLEDYLLDRIKNLNGEIIYDSKFDCEGYSIPITEFIKDFRSIFKSAAVIGAISAYFNLNFKEVERVFQEEYGEAEIDITIAKRSYEYFKEKYGAKREIRYDKPKRFLLGAEAIADGLIKAGLRCFYAYPMTPASPIFHKILKRDIIAYQAESEIACVMMAIGSAFAGKRAATATSGGGFCLMTESIGLAAIAEIPLMIIEAQRSGPSTGMATFHGQEDLNFVLYPSHGEFPLVVASPYCIEDAYVLSAELLNLAWKYQVQTLMLTDKVIVESYTTAEIRDVKEEEVEVIRESDGIFKRYEITESGLSKYAIPPAIVKANSNEHDEFGLTTDDAEIRRRMHEKRMKKEKLIEKEVQNKAYIEMLSGEEAIVTWGSSFGVAYDIANEFGYKLIAIRYLRPFFVPKIKKAIVIESNYTSQLGKMLRSYGIEVESILKWNGRAFTPEEIREAIA